MKVFQSRGGKLSGLEIKNSKGMNFENEKTIQALIENNLNEIFTDLEFVKTEHQIDDLRIDTIAFDKNRNSFVIIEYKNKKDEDVLAQGISYYELLQDKKGEFVLLYNNLKKTHYDIAEINWDEARIIFIAPIFTKYQKKASGFAGLPTEFYEIKKYENGIITLDRIDVKTEQRMTAGEKKARGKSHIAYAEYTEEDYLSGKYETTPTLESTKKLWYEFKNAILENFEQLEFKQMKKYAGFYSKDDNSCICTIDATKSAIWLSYATTEKNFFPKSNFVNYTTKGHFGIGHYRSLVKNRNDVMSALMHIRKIYVEKVKSGSQHPGFIFTM